MTQSQTEHLTIAELLGGVPEYDKPPQGWKHPKAIAKIPPFTEVYIQNLRSGRWEKGIVEDYWERGSFLEVRCGKRLQKIFLPENLATKQISLIV